ncbi:MAG: C40 family peptidase [Cyanobacteria bacterium]|nr:C40 family peptidase [Cyanobacteriota bacterium]
MVSREDLGRALDRAVVERPQWRCGRTLDLYSRPDGQSLTTQIAAGRQVRAIAVDGATDMVQLQGCEDDYPGWVAIAQLAHLTVADAPYQALTVTRSQIEAKIPDAIAFGMAALAVPNRYRWGGSTAPDYDCSGLVQAAFVSVGIWLPRDSYLQQDFTAAIARDEELMAGDLLFFGSPERTDHVAIYLGQGRYLHSSGYDHGRGGMAIDSLIEGGEGDDVIAQYYRQRRRGAGRLLGSYQPTGQLP